MFNDEGSVLTKGPLIWALDDDPMMVSMLEDMFVGGGYRFRGFELFEDMMHALNEVGHHVPHVFLIDLMLSASTGTHVIRTLNQHDLYAPIPKIVLTGNALEGAMHNAFDAGADDFIRKPFSIIELTARVRVHVRAHRQLKHEQAHRQTVEVLTRLASLDSSGDSVEAHLDAVQQVLLETSNALAVVCLHVQEGTGVLMSSGQEHAAWSDLRDAPGLERAMLTGQGVLLRTHHPDLARWPMLEHMGLAREALTHSTLAFVPLMHNGRAIGALAALVEHRPEALFELLTQCAQVCAPRVIGVELAQRRERQLLAMRDVQDMHTYLNQVLAASPHAIVAADRQGRILLFNQAASDILGWTMSRGIGMSVERLYPGEQAREIMRKLRDDGLDGVGVLRNARQALQNHEGQQIPVLLSAALIVDEQGREIGSVGIFTDLRERLDLESQVKRARLDLHVEQQSHVDSYSRVDTSGDLIQPLTTLLGYVELLQGCDPLPHEVTARALTHIHASAQRLARMIEHPLLDPVAHVVNPRRES